MRNIQLSIASFSLLILIAVIFNQVQLAIDHTVLHGGMITRFFTGLFGFIGKAMLLVVSLYIVYQSWVKIKVFHVLFEIPRLVVRGVFFCFGLVLITTGYGRLNTLSGIAICMFGVALVLFLLGKWLYEMSLAYRDLLRRKIVR